MPLLAHTGKCSTDADGGGRIGDRAGTAGARPVAVAGVGLRGVGGDSEDRGTGVERVRSTEPHPRASREVLRTFRGATVTGAASTRVASRKEKIVESEETFKYQEF